MSIPIPSAPAVNANDALVEILSRLDRIEASIEKVRAEVIGPEWVDRKYVARQLDISPEALGRRPWDEPLFGRSEDGRGKKRWRRETVEAWLARPQEERRAEWEKMSCADRLRILGASA